MRWECILRMLPTQLDAVHIIIISKVALAEEWPTHCGLFSQSCINPGDVISTEIMQVVFDKGQYGKSHISDAMFTVKMTDGYLSVPLSTGCDNPTSPPGALFRTLPLHMLSRTSWR